MDVTSVHFNSDGGTIKAEGQMSTNGRTYATYRLTARPDGKSGWADVKGGSVLGVSAFASGAAVGIYSCDGTILTIHFPVNMQDGAQNLDEVMFNTYTHELTHDVFVV